MAEICDICLTELERWKDYDSMDCNLESILCLKCKTEVIQLYNQSGKSKLFEECIEEVRKQNDKKRVKSANEKQN
ncbi:hypothetical protein J4463_02680 [Candidatus Pacearchaeota archaeon]|nr:hypothetical protein [Candidatus Pacearchaeota archaeon]